MPNISPTSGGVERALVRTSDGRVVTLSQQLEQDKGEAEISSVGLRPGDQLAFLYHRDGQDRRFTFDITSAEWVHMGVEGYLPPGPQVLGRLYGIDDLAPEVEGQEVVFGGTGWGGSMWQSRVIRTGGPIVFQLLDEREFHSPPIRTFDIFQSGLDGAYRPCSPNQMDNRSGLNIPQHNARLLKAEELMVKFGFKPLDIKDGSPRQEPTTEYYFDGRFIANYEAGGARGNQLAVLDRDTGLWFEIKFFNFRGDDILQLAFADLFAQNLKETFLTGRLAEESGVHISRVPITTYTTSGRYGIEVTNYKMGGTDAKQIYAVGYPPDIQFWPNGSVKVAQTRPFSEEEKKQPGVTERIVNSVHTQTSPDGSMNLVINGASRLLPNPDAYIDFLLATAKGSNIGPRQFGSFR